jgi:two-component sensor histidine kinase
MTSQQLPDSVRHKGCNILEALSNLLYLAELEADDPGKVRSYLSMSKERVEAMANVLEGDD